MSEVGEGRGEMELRVGRCGMVDARGGIRDEGVGMRDGECEVVGDEDGRRLIGGVGERWWSDDAKCHVRDVGRWTLDAEIQSRNAT